jgi:hypothetical protein
MDVDAQSRMANDLLAALAARVGGVLALQVKVVVIDSVVNALVRVCPALLVESGLLAFKMYWPSRLLMTTRSRYWLPPDGLGTCSQQTGLG